MLHFELLPDEKYAIYTQIFDMLKNDIESDKSISSQTFYSIIYYSIFRLQTVTNTFNVILRSFINIVNIFHYTFIRY